MRLEQFHKYMRQGGYLPLRIVEVDGRLWATDSYWLTPFEGSLAESLLRRCNLTGEPGTYDCGKYPQRLDGALPVLSETVAKILATPTPVPLSLRFVEERRNPLCVHDRGNWLSMWDRPDGTVTVIYPKLLRIILPADSLWWEASLSQGEKDARQLVQCGESFVMPRSRAGR